MRYCVLCGIPITRSLHEPWLRDFRAIWIENDNWSDVRLSGVGLCDEYDDIIAGAVPIDPHKRYSDQLDPDSVISVGLVTFDLEHVLHPKPFDEDGSFDGDGPSSEDEPSWGYAFHASCWDLLNVGFMPDIRLLFQACLSMPVGWDNMTDWGHDYGGAASVRRNHDIPILESRFADFESIPGEMRSDPFRVPSLAKAIRRTARLRHDASQPHTSSNRLDQGQDKFSRLPPELLQLIIALLPTKHVRSLRLASPAFATLTLSERFWESRFRQGHEFEYIFEASRNPPESWRALYLSLQIWAPDSPSMANRRRVWGLAKQLRLTLAQMEGVSCHGTPLNTWFDPSVQGESPGGKEAMSWRTAARGVTDPCKTFDHGCRPFRSRSVAFLHPPAIQSMSVSFVHTGGGTFVSGLLFVDKAGQSHPLGYIHHHQSVTIRLSSTQGIQGWELALDLSGVKAIALIGEDGSQSAWAGDPGNLPRWRLAGMEHVSAVKAEFDALKLASLSRNSSTGPSGQARWRDSCLWYPEAPPAGMLFNGSRGDQPPGHFDLPVTYVFFGGRDGRDLSTLVEIVIWTLDLWHIAGLEFHYADGSRTQQLGLIGPFDDDHAVAKNYDTSESGCIRISIDGAGGEELTGVEVQENGGVTGLKLRTNTGREVTTPQCHFSTDEDWATVEPAGSKAVGLFCTHGEVLWSLGLISTSDGDDV